MYRNTTLTQYAKEGNVHGLIWELWQGQEWNSNLCTIATKYGHICILYFADANGLLMDMENIYDIAHRCMHIKIIQWLYEKHYKINECKQLLHMASMVSNILENQYYMYQSKNKLLLAEDMITSCLLIRNQVNKTYHVYIHNSLCYRFTEQMTYHC
jgi:hypothetical protein